MLKLRQRRAIRRETRELFLEVVEDFQIQNLPLTKSSIKKEVLRRRSLQQAIFNNLSPETRTAIRELFMKFLEMFINRLFAQLS